MSILGDNFEETIHYGYNTSHVESNMGIIMFDSQNSVKWK